MPTPHIRPIRYPTLIWVRTRELVYQVRIPWLILWTVGRVPPDASNACMHAELVQQAAYHVAINEPAVTAHLRRHAPIAIVRAANHDLFNGRAQRFVIGWYRLLLGGAAWAVEQCT